MPEGERLQKALARAGVASRRAAEALIVEGRVTVNGAPATELGRRVDPLRDAVALNGVPVELRHTTRYLALHKPAGTVTTVRDPQGRPTVMELMPDVPGLFPVGRLDTASTGLLLLTNDGDWAQQVMHPRYGSEKEYEVEVHGVPSLAVLQTLRGPMVLAPGERTTGAEVEVLDWRAAPTLLRVVLHEGRNRQIRRMMDLVGHSVVRLQRVRVGPVLLGDLPEGQWRDLTAREVTALAARPQAVARGATVRLRRRLA